MFILNPQRRQTFEKKIFIIIMQILTLKHMLLSYRISKIILSRSDKLYCDYREDAESVAGLSGAQSKQVKCDLAGLFVILTKSSLTLSKLPAHFNLQFTHQISADIMFWVQRGGTDRLKYHSSSTVWWPRS